MIYVCMLFTNSTNSLKEKEIESYTKRSLALKISRKRNRLERLHK